MKLRILSLSIRAMFRPLGIVAGPDYQHPRWPIFPVAWPTPEHPPRGRLVRFRAPNESDDLYAFNSYLTEGGA